MDIANGEHRTARSRVAPAVACVLSVLLLVGIGLADSAGALPGQNSVTSDDIKNGAVTSADIKDRTIRTIDVKAGTFQRAGTHHTVTLYEDQSSGTISTNGTGQGAVDAWNDFDVYDNAALTGSPVATDVGYDITQTGGQFNITVAFRFANGDLHMTGIWTIPAGPETITGEFAIIGGTGAYKGARGAASASLPSPYELGTYTLDYTTP